MNLYEASFLPAPLWIITALHIVTLTLHFIAMNFLFGGTVVLLLAKIHNKWENSSVATFVKLLPTAMGTTVTLGVAPLLFVQLVYGNMIYSASIVSGWYWLMISFVAIFSYYLLYAGSFTKTTKRKGTYLALSLIGFIYISLVYSSVFSLAEFPAQYHALYSNNQTGLAFNSDIGTWGFRWLHIVLGATTVGAWFVGLVGRNDDKVFTEAKKFFLWGMVATMIVGFVYMMTLGEHMLPFMRSAGIWAVTVGLILSLGSLHFFFKKRFLFSGIMIDISILCMVITRHVVRLLRLDGIYNPTTLPVDPQWSVFFIFLISFVLMIAVVWYMLRLFFKDTSKSAT